MHRANARTWLRPYSNGLLKLSLQLFWGVLQQQWWSRFEDKRVSHIDLLPQKQSFCKMVTIHTKALHSYSTHLFQHWKRRTRSTISCTYALLPIKFTFLLEFHIQTIPIFLQYVLIHVWLSKNCRNTTSACSQMHGQTSCTKILTYRACFDMILVHVKQTVSWSQKRRRIIHLATTQNHIWFHLCKFSLYIYSMRIHQPTSDTTLELSQLFARDKTNKFRHIH